MESGDWPSLSIRKRKAILLVAGDKSGVSEKRFYRELVRQADRRFDAHLIRLKEERT
jgi:hypothetical protein